MAIYIKEGDIVEGQKTTIKARKIEFKKGGLRKDPITNKNMVLYELDRNCSVDIMESLTLSEEDIRLREKQNIHGSVGDKIQGEAIRLYVDSKRNCLKPVVKEGQSARHGASLIDTNIRTIGRIKTPFSVYNKLLGYSANSNNPQID